MNLRLSPYVSVGAARRRPTAAAGLAAGVLVAGLASIAPVAEGAIGPPCPEPFPTQEVAAGQSVTGLTVARGTVPEEFSGEVIGRLENGLLPGIDLVMVRLSSAEIERAGIWEGMSGSPVYAADGRLIGAVAYGFSLAPSPIAGVVPGEEMLDLLPPDSRDGEREAATRVELPQRLARRLVASGDATTAQVRDGLRPLGVPLAVSGVSDRAARLIEKRLESPWVRVVRSVAGSASRADAIPVTPGGNLVATLAYGDVTAGGVGTATAVCDEAVVGFGHPMYGTGSTRMGMHGANALRIQEDLLLPAYKIVNIGTPAGAIRQDRHVGIAGTLGAPPEGPVVTSTIRRGDESRTGRTDVYYRSFLVEFAFSHIASNIDRALGLGGGTARTDLRITGTLDGRPFTVRRADAHTSGNLAFTVADDAAMPLDRLRRFKETAVTNVALTASVDRTSTRAVVKGVSVRRNGRWVWLSRGGTLTLPAERTALLRASMQRTTGGPHWHETLRVRVPASAAGSSGSLRVVGGGAELLDRTQQARTAAGLIAALRTTPRNDEVVAHLRLPSAAGGVREDRALAGRVVVTSNPFTVRALIR